jgi:hypothetical protein
MIIHVQFGFFQASDITLSINAGCCLYFRDDYFEIVSPCMIDNLFLYKGGQKRVLLLEDIPSLLPEANYNLFINLHWAYHNIRLHGKCHWH